ncbi:group II intron reverse transcriptase/maturase [Agaribacter flavus]|uniref:RNA-directed DNA polymerase n=1 Tax=Agaribacter flavus TaxID=1902781 RepID=A0ABV7FUG7_9ALTE
MQQDERQLSAKSFDIPKGLIWEAWKRVAVNKGAAGVDGKTISHFKENLSANLYKIWNRMCSGSYFPEAVRQVMIPKADGNLRPLGIPTVGDRVAQMAAKMLIEPSLEQVFHPSSFGYRPARSAHQAVSQAKQHCWRYDWVLDIDMKAFFDTIDHDLMMKAVEKHVQEPWLRLYIKRWLEAPVCTEEKEVVSSTKGTPQGGVISPLLANLFLHYAFDAWISESFPTVPFERYADDIVCHCRTKLQAQTLLQALEERMSACKLQLHPVKTKIVYCKDKRRKGLHTHTRFDFLGFTFQARTVQDKGGKLFTGFNPAVSKVALKRMFKTLRDMNINQATRLTIFDLAKKLNPVVKGWVGYYAKFYPQILHRALVQIDLRLGRWARKKYKRLRGHKRQSWNWLKRIRSSHPALFAHWEFVYLRTVG